MGGVREHIWVPFRVSFPRAQVLPFKVPSCSHLCSPVSPVFSLFSFVFTCFHLAKGTSFPIQGSILFSPVFTSFTCFHLFHLAKKGTSPPIQGFILFSPVLTCFHPFHLSSPVFTCFHLAKATHFPIQGSILLSPGPRI